MLETHNHLEELRKEFEDSRLAKMLESKYAIKPYHIKYKPFYVLSIISALFFNFFSVSLASVFVYSVFQPIFKIVILSGLVTFTLLALLELTKWLLLTSIYERFFQFRKLDYGKLFLLFVMMSISVLLSYPGGEKLPKIASKPEVIKYASNNEIVKLEAEINKLNSDKKNYETDKSFRVKSGEIAYNVRQKIIPVIVSDISSRSERLTRLKEAVDKKNSSNETKFEIQSSINGKYFAFGVFLCDLLLLLSINFKERYEYRSAVEILGIKSRKTIELPKPKIEITEIPRISKTEIPEILKEEIIGKQEVKPVITENPEITEQKTKVIIRNVPVASDDMDIDTLKSALSDANKSLSVYRSKYKSASEKLQKAITEKEKRKWTRTLKTNEDGIDKWVEKVEHYEGRIEAIQNK